MWEALGEWIGTVIVCADMLHVDEVVFDPVKDSVVVYLYVFGPFGGLTCREHTTGAHNVFIQDCSLALVETKVM